MMYVLSASGNSPQTLILKALKSSAIKNCALKSSKQKLYFYGILYFYGTKNYQKRVS